VRIAVGWPDVDSQTSTASFRVSGATVFTFGRITTCLSSSTSDAANRHPEAAERNPSARLVFRAGTHHGTRKGLAPNLGL